MTVAARSSGRVWRSAPRPDFPIAVRKQSTITASRILVPQCLSVLQHVLHALLRTRIAAQTEERFPLQIHQILLADVLRAGELSTAQHIGQLPANHAIVFRDVAA